jgi:transcriptional regulator with XRE-family HTH domain
LAETTFPEFITARRRELELTLGDVASDVGVSPITVSNWSSGQSVPKKENLVALAAVLDFPADELAGMAGVELDHEPGPEPEPEIVIETDAPADGTSGGDPGVNVEVADPQVVPTADIPTIEHPAVAGTEETEKDVEELVMKESAVEAEDPPKVDEEVSGDPATPAPEEIAPAPDSVPDVIPRVAVSPPTPPQLGPLTYVQDPKQLLRYRIRWGITTVVLIVMAFVLFWALGGLFDALSEVKESVTP